jgi:hypothetical protein
MMGYYRGGDCMYGRGDYYRGDYYRGDPGLFSFLGKAVGGIAKAVGGIVPGPLGALAKAAGGVLAPSKSTMPAPLINSMAPGGQGFGIGYFAPGGGGVGIGSFSQGGNPNNLPGFPTQQPVGTMTSQGFIPGCQLKGTRPNKSGYYKQVQKGNPFTAVYIPKHSVCVKTRRMNIANGRALRRAVRRAQGFAKMARRVLTFVSAHAPKGRAKFKRK